jgi:cytochrome c oxidase subunit 1
MSMPAATASDPLPAERTDADDERLRRELESTWEDRPGLWGWLCSVDHKSIGKRYIITAFAFLVLGGLLAAAMRLQLARPEAGLVGPDLYNQLFTMHGSTMMFLFAVPMMEAVAVYLLPLMVGTRIIAFPRLNAFSYWVYLFGGLMIWVAFALNVGPDAGWFAYTPLAGPEYGAGKRADIWAQTITFTELSALAVAIEIIVTTFKLRAPGMSLDRIPLFVWAMLVTAFMIVFAMPAVMLASSFLISDRLIATHFFNPAEGGDSLLWQHLFWFFGHPEVYIIFLPALGMISSIIEAFARRPVFGYVGMVCAQIATGFLGFGLWVHHMFATGLPRLGNSFFTAASIAIALPTGLQIFCWIATLWDGRIRWRVPLLFVVGFFFVFVIGGLSGVMIASVPFDLQVHDSYFIVAHFHYVLIGGAVFPLMGAFYFWFPKITGRLLHEGAGRWNFWLLFVGFNVAFFPMHLLGLRGMPRRVYTYPEGLGWDALNLLSTTGALLVAASFLLFILNVLYALRAGERAGPDPWDASTLEWATSSPPPAYNFLHLPVVSGPTPLWEHRGELPGVTGIRSNTRELLTTSVLDARPETREPGPDPMIWPLLAAIATTVLFVASIFRADAVIWGAIPVGIAITGWLWPRAADPTADPQPSGRAS